jgi:cell division protein FtsZ
MLEFDAPKDQSSIIKVIGVGGGGSNAVNHMYKLGIKGVDFILCNTDAQALNASPIPNKIQLGQKGLGAGSKPAVGRESALESIELLKEQLHDNTQMLFITAGMGGGTGTGAAPVIASVAKELGILTVGIVTLPFSFEGRKRLQQADEGISELNKYVDTLLVINNDKLRELHGNLKLSEAFGQADDVLTIAAKGIAEIITVVGYINVDFEDVKTVMQDSGKAIMGSSTASGDNRAQVAAQEVLSSPLLDDNNIKGADDILLYIASGDEEISMDEVTEITDYVQEAAGNEAEIIWGTGTDESLENKISVTLIATGFDKKAKKEADLKAEENVTRVNLYEEAKGDKVGSGNRFNFESSEEKVAPEPEGPYLKSDLEAKSTDVVEAVSREELIDIEEPVLIKKETTETFTPIQETIKPVSEQKEIFSSEVKPVTNERIPDLSPELEEKLKKSQERVNKLKGFSMYRRPEDLEDMENVPAYKRRGVDINHDVTPSEDTERARYTLGEGENDQIQLKKDNSFLHKDVD